MQRTRFIIYGLLGMLLLAGFPVARRLIGPAGYLADEEDAPSPAATLPVTEHELPPTIVEPDGDWLSSNQRDPSEPDRADEETLDNPLHHVAAPRPEESPETLQR